MTARPPPPLPGVVRCARESFGWLEARWLHEGWLERLGPDATSVLVLLALAADRHGVSFYRRDRMAQRLGMTRVAIDQALRTLLDLELIAHRPWRRDDVDGVWQLLPLRAPDLSRTPDTERRSGAGSVANILAQLGFAPPAKPPESGAN